MLWSGTGGYQERLGEEKEGAQPLALVSRKLCESHFTAEAPCPQLQNIFDYPGTLRSQGKEQRKDSL